MNSEDSDNEGVIDDPNPRETPEKEILWAAENGEFEIVEQLLKVNPELVNVTDSDGYSPLHRACYENHEAVAKLLLTNNANVSAVTQQNWTPLHSACKWNCGKCVSLLLDWDANVNAVTIGGLTPLHLAASNNAYESMWMLLTHPLIDLTIRNSNDETALELCQRNSPYSKIFDITHKSINII